MITTGTFITDDNRMELINSEPGSFPCICNHIDFANYVGNCAAWHWHQRFEINYLIEGRAIERFENDTYHLGSGEAMFINSNVLHAVESSDSYFGKMFRETMGCSPRGYRKEYNHYARAGSYEDA